MNVAALLLFMVIHAFIGVALEVKTDYSPWTAYIIGVFAGVITAALIILIEF